MNYLKSASFGGLFAVTFTVAASCQVAFSLLGLLMVTLAPGLFQMNGVAATNPMQAFGVLLFLLAFGLVLNAGMSAIGSLIWMVARMTLPRANEVTS